jgi:type IV secretory pathway VirD2 relaxase
MRQPKNMLAGTFPRKPGVSGLQCAVAAIFARRTRPVSMTEDDFTIRPGKIRSRGSKGGRRALTLAGQIIQYSVKGGYAGGARRGSGTGHQARGRRAALAARSRATNRRVVIKARVVRHGGNKFRAAPLARHIAYLERDGVTRDGRDASMFEVGTNDADRDAFAERCGDDRHHFRFIVSPEDASEMSDIRAFTRELMGDMARDLDTRLDWVAVDHWNTDNPHVHILLRGKASDGKDLVIDKDYVRAGMRARAEDRVTIELGPRSELEINRALTREVDAERWTSLDRALQRIADVNAGIVDLRPGAMLDDMTHPNVLRGRAMKLDRLGLADKIAPACWTLKPGIETTLRDMSVRGDIIKTMHRAMSARGAAPDLSRFALHNEVSAEPVFGRLVERGLHDELAGSAYAVVDGADGRTHHLRFSDIDMTTDASPGALVELRHWTDGKGCERQSLAVRSDLPLGAQVTADGATWLDRQLVAKEPLVTGDGFGSEVRVALSARADHLVARGMARRQGQQLIFARAMLDKLQSQELSDSIDAIAERTGLAHRASAAGEYVTGTYRERVTLASGRFAMIDDGLGFQLVPWRPALDQHLGQAVAGTMNARGGVDWSFGRSRGIEI